MARDSSVVPIVLPIAPVITGVVVSGGDAGMAD